jgi:hypothetical protein
MTGSLLFNRQHSSTAGYSKANKMARPKLRRCSSADEHYSFEVQPDDNQDKSKFFTKRNQTPSDIDSGIEDFDQHTINTVWSPPNNVGEEEQLPCFGACEDEDFEENPAEIITHGLQDLEQQVLQCIRNDRKLL